MGSVNIFKKSVNFEQAESAHQKYVAWNKEAIGEQSGRHHQRRILPSCIYFGRVPTPLGPIRVNYTFDRSANDESRETIFNLIIDIFGELRYSSGLWGAAYKSANIGMEKRTISASIPPQCIQEFFQVIESRFSSSGDFIYLELYGQKNIMIIGMWLQKLTTKQISSITGFNRKTIRSLLNKIGRIDIPKYYASMPS